MSLVLFGLQALKVSFSLNGYVFRSSIFFFSRWFGSGFTVPFVGSQSITAFIKCFIMSNCMLYTLGFPDVFSLYTISFIGSGCNLSLTPLLIGAINFCISSFLFRYLNSWFLSSVSTFFHKSPYSVSISTLSSSLGSIPYFTIDFKRSSITLIAIALSITFSFTSFPFVLTFRRLSMKTAL